MEPIQIVTMPASSVYPIDEIVEVSRAGESNGVPVLWLTVSNGADSGDASVLLTVETARQVIGALADTILDITTNPHD